jgi:aminoglycoside phosphotransferase family enzyme
MDIEKLLNDLQMTNAFPEPTDSVKLIQTHISWVFICDNYVYKLKKPVNFGFLDFETLEKRKFYCHQEVELNKRLAEDVYLGVVSVVLDNDMYKIIDQPDERKPIEYAVKMRVIPDDVLLKNRFKNGLLTESDIDKTAKTIVNFHATAEHSPDIDKFGTLEIVKFNTDENFAQTEEFIGKSITNEKFNALKSWTDEFYKDQTELLNHRISAGRIRDCHGDLHMEHICLTDPIKIIDCIEFNDRFRYSDTASDLAFLLMDLEFHGGGQFANQLYDFYKKYSGEAGSEFDLILKYYKIYRAYVRGKVSSFQLNDPNISDDKKEDARSMAQKYFDLAYKYIEG